MPQLPTLFTAGLSCFVLSRYRLTMSSRWRQTSPTELADWLAGVDIPWGFAGGWALDLWGGEVSRDHSDIEIACFRADLPGLLPKLADFEIAIARDKQLTPYLAGSLPEPPFSLWLRRHGEVLWDFEIVAESRAGSDWVYRRDPRISRSSETVFAISPAGFPIIAPEIQLLYKCREPRPKDIDDLVRYVPRLDEAARLWLRAAVALAHPAFLATFDDIVASRALNDGDLQ